MLQKLELHGFKTFASKTHFCFPEGITVIVGPNGSGKSNIADSIRWILGEQRTSMLRARKSDDLIFSGTERRTRMGMAQGFMSLDNSSGILPIDFSEVVVGRRVFRSGESEYLINGTRVRLRDIQELLAHASVGTTTYTVIGQGLVDAALALRAEERRQLFEDAAGLGAYQGKRNEALRRLTQTGEHLTRVRDILTEIEPRLKRLRRQAERAEESIELNEMLRGLLRQLYGYRWGKATEALSSSRETLVEGRSRLQEATLEVVNAERRLEQLRQRQNELRDTLTERRRERGRLRAEAERLRREHAVAIERERGLHRQREALQQEIAALEAERETLYAQLEEMAQEGDTLHGVRNAAQAKLEQSKQELAEAENVREEIRRSLGEVRRTLGKLTARQGELAQQQIALRDRREELTKEHSMHEQARVELEERLVRRAADICVLEEELEAIQRQRAELMEEQQSLLIAQQDASEAHQEAHQALHDVQRRLTALTTRHDLLAQLREEGAGYEEGVRALLTERARFADTLLGPVADHLRVPEALSSAVSAALSSQLQGIVLRDCAESVRSWLHEEKRGRVRLLPLPALHVPQCPNIPTGDNILGRGADLVQADDPALLEYLLGEWLVVKDWSAAEALRGSGWNLVTLDGQVHHHDGTLIVGRGEGKGTTLLAQSREWVALPEQIASVEQEQSEAETNLYEATGALETLEAQLARLERARLENERQRQTVEATRQREQRDLEKLQQEQVWRQDLVKKIDAEIGTLTERASSVGTAIEALTVERGTTEAHVAELEQQLEATHPGALREMVERARTEVAVTDEQLASWRRNQQALEASLARLVQQQERKAQQAARLDTEVDTLAGRMEILHAEALRAEEALQRSLDQTEPLEQEQACNEETLAELETLHHGLRKQRQEQEDRVHTAQLAVQAAEERLDHLREQIEIDLGVVEIDELITSLPRVGTLPEGLEHDVRRLRRRIGYLGPINPDAPAEYAEIAERYTFLSEQADDLTRASRDLRQIVAELDQIMEERFLTTFEAIDEAFGCYFTRLFNGGQARLELIDPENINETGIEIMARPPGKRAQSIALLSGGERALTAAALLFAILKVSPTPFCVFDEVDAMLDEANIGRFREVLVELSDETQFIVITHNRGTIEAAHTIYGIAQSDPGISEVISLQLEEAVRAAKQ
ncbi:MAG: chromosome segregation protein SMC [Chloroflexota bacterium]|nr:chromosome segregation protein SMC [Chloroflexota bacterium]